MGPHFFVNQLGRTLARHSDVNAPDDVGQTLVAEGANIMVNRVDRHLRFFRKKCLVKFFFATVHKYHKMYGKVT